MIPISKDRGDSNEPIYELTPRRSAILIYACSRARLIHEENQDWPAMGGNGKNSAVKALDVTATLAEFVRRGKAAQDAVDAIIAAHNRKS